MNRRFNLAENQEPEPPQEARMGFGVFFILMLAFPVQYYLSDSYGASVISRNQNAHSLVKGTTSFIKTYLTPSSITKNLNNINNILENYLQELEQTKQMTKKKKRTVHSASGESPAHEVIQYRGQGKGYFGHSSEVRDRELGDEVEYYVGQVFRHKKYDYYGVIVGWDRECVAPERWKKDNLGSRWQKMQKQPFYSVLTNKGDSRYVAQENIQLVGGNFKLTSKKTAATRINEMNIQVQDYFDFYDESTESFHPRPAIKLLYPDD